MFPVVTHLQFPAAFRLINGSAHRTGDNIAVHDYLALSVSRCTADGLNQRCLGAQKAFFIGIQNGYQRYFRQIQPLTQKVDAYQHIKFPLS